MYMNLHVPIYISSLLGVLLLSFNTHILLYISYFNSSYIHSSYFHSSYIHSRSPIPVTVTELIRENEDDGLPDKEISKSNAYD